MSVEEHTPTPQEARGIYGLVLYFFMKLFIVFYFLWMFSPLEYIHSMPYAPPQQYWGIAVPVFCCTGLFAFAFYIYPALHGLHDCSFDDPSCIMDVHSHPADYFEKERAKARISAPQRLRNKKKINNRPTLKALKVSAEIHEKSMTLSAKEKKFREMQIRPIRAFPECDTKPIPTICDLDLDFVCKKIHIGGVDNE